MVADRTRRFDTSEAFFLEGGSPWMKLIKPAACEVIAECSERGVGISVIEVGIWHRPGFEARLDAIWHSKNERKGDVADVKANNSSALQFVEELPDEYDTVILSTFGNEV